MKGVDSGLGEARGPGSSGRRQTCDSQTVFLQIVNSQKTGTTYKGFPGQASLESPGLNVVKWLFFLNRRTNQ